MKGSLSSLMGVGVHLNTAFVRAMGQVPCLSHCILSEVTQSSSQLAFPCTSKDSLFFLHHSSAFKPGKPEGGFPRDGQRLVAWALIFSALGWGSKVTS